jgi:hypothetical protein
MSYAFSINHLGELSGQNLCASGTRNIESNTHGLTQMILIVSSCISAKFLLRNRFPNDGHWLMPCLDSYLA